MVDQNDYGKRISFKSYFDKYFPDVPVVLNRVDARNNSNSKVLAMANITKDTKVSEVKLKLKRRAYWDINR
jgi:predicted amidohydrolase YtcJ